MRGRLAVGLAFVLGVSVPAASGQPANLLTNPGLVIPDEEPAGADVVPMGWAMEEGGAAPHPANLSTAEPGDFSHLQREGSEDRWHMWFQPWQASFYNHGGFAHLSQYVAGTPGLTYTMTGWSLFETWFPGGVDNMNSPDGDEDFEDGIPSPTHASFALEFISWENALLPGSVEIDLREDGQMNDVTWRQHTLTAVAPPLTWIVRVRASMEGGRWNEGADPQSYLADDFSLTATAPTFLAGDFNENGFVDGGDALLWQRQLGSNVPLNTGADGDGSSSVTGNDLTVWSGQFGQPAVAVGAAIPEPTAALLALLAATSLIGSPRSERPTRS